MKREELIKQIRELLLRHFFGTLSTINASHPYGSLARYSTDQQGQPVFLLSAIAEHTKNIQLNNKANLFILEQTNENIQECPRVSLSGEIIAIKKDDEDFEHCLTKHFVYFPDAQQYFEQLDFQPYRLLIDECHYVGGFAAAHKISGNDFRIKNPIDDASLNRIISHMNEDHVDALIHYCEKENYPLDGHPPILVSVDARGFNIRINKTIKRIRFVQDIHDAGTARDAFVAMART